MSDQKIRRKTFTPEPHKNRKTTVEEEENKIYCKSSDKKDIIEIESCTDSENIFKSKDWFMMRILTNR